MTQNDTMGLLPAASSPIGRHRHDAEGRHYIRHDYWPYDEIELPHIGAEGTCMLYGKVHKVRVIDLQSASADGFLDIVVVEDIETGAHYSVAPSLHTREEQKEWAFYSPPNLPPIELQLDSIARQSLHMASILSKR
jgi:hypothetical protein